MGGYEIGPELGRGGFAVVYRAVQLELGRTVALKVLLPEVWADRDNCERFMREIKTLMRLRHPGIVKVLDTGTLDEGPFYAMELLEARPLDRVVADDGPLAPRRALGLLRQAADALGYCHSQGMTHRDVKPSNMMVGEADCLTLMDFGLARGQGGTFITADQQIMGTPRYLAPELLRGQPSRPASDMYSLGISFYEVLTGQPAFVTATMTELLGRIIKQGPAPLLSVRPDLPAPVVDLVTRLVDRSPDRRPSAAETVAAVGEALEAHKGRRTPSVPGVDAVRLAAERARRRVMGVMLGVLASAAGAWWMTTGRLPPPPVRAAARASPAPSVSPALVGAVGHVLAACARIRGRTPDWQRLAGLASVVAVTGEAADSVSLGRQLITTESADREELATFCAAVRRTYQVVEEVPDDLVGVWLEAQALSFWSWSRIERLAHVRERWTDARPPPADSATDALETLATWMQPVYGAAGATLLDDWFYVCRVALGRVARDPRAAAHRLGPTLFLLLDVARCFEYGGWTPDGRRPGDLAIGRFLAALDRLERPEGPAIGRVAGQLWRWAYAPSGTALSRQELRDAVRAIQADLQGLATRIPPAAPPLEAIARRLSQETGIRGGAPGSARHDGARADGGR